MNSIRAETWLLEGATIVSKPRVDHLIRLRCGYDRKTTHFIILLMLWFGILSSSVFADEPNVIQPPVAESEVRDQNPDATEPSPIPDPVRVAEDNEKRKKVAIMMSAIGGIVILGIGAIAVLMIWARHLRRVARDRGPLQRTEGNDFWFLKPPKPTVSDSNIGETHRPIHTTPDENKPE